MKTSESIKELATALSKAQGEILGAPKESKNPFFNSTYADLDSCREAMRGPFAKHGLSLTQNVTSISMQVKDQWDAPIFNKDDKEVGRDVGSKESSYAHLISAMLLHSSGEWIQYDPVLVPIKEPNNPQALKSGITYMRRAQLLAICAMSEADDDGNEATQAQFKPLPPLPNHAPGSKGVLTMPFGKSKGTPLDKLPREEIRSAIEWAKSKGKFLDFVKQAEGVLNEEPMPELPPDFDSEIPF